jgi:hypothetical protein
MSRAEYIKQNWFHVTVALHHLREINPDLLSPEQVKDYTVVMRAIEGMNNAPKNV